MNAEEVERQLSEVERQHDIKVIFAAESGSKSWGLASPDSDNDVRFIYIHTPRWYLSIQKGRKETLEIKNKDTGIDLLGWDLPKALFLLRESNPGMLDWLRSPVVYRREQPFTDTAVSLAQKHFAELSLAFHYLNMARKHRRLYFEHDESQKEVVTLKKYFYVLRPLLGVKWIMLNRKQELPKAMPPIAFDEVLANLEASIPQEVYQQIIVLAEKKRASAIGEGPRIPILDTWIDETFQEAIQFCDNAPTKSKHDLPAYDEFDELFYTTATKHLISRSNADDVTN
ncbi:Nucleotidyltransferase [Balamuthia mandrillaris]